MNPLLLLRESITLWQNFLLHSNGLLFRALSVLETSRQNQEILTSYGSTRCYRLFFTNDQLYLVYISTDLMMCLTIWDSERIGFPIVSPMHKTLIILKLYHLVLICMILVMLWCVFLFLAYLHIDPWWTIPLRYDSALLTSVTNMYCDVSSTPLSNAEG